MQIWQPIKNLPIDWQDLAHEELVALAEVWKEQKARLENTQSYKNFLAQMRRRIAIETGIIERLYSIDRGTTQLLIEHGIDEALIQHGATDQPVAQVVALIRDHERALEGVFQFVANQRQLSTSYIKELHALLTKNQETIDAIDQFGKWGKVKLLRGDWKKQPNNPQRNGDTYYYCPPIQVASEMDSLVALHREHEIQGINPDVSAAWLHHRFTQIHPFQDGNGRVARVLANLVFIKAEWFPLVITDSDRDTYISALEHADIGNLKPLIDLFAKAQKQAFLSSLSLSEEILAEAQTSQAILDAAIAKIRKKQETQFAEAKQIIKDYAQNLWEVAKERFSDLENTLKVSLKEVVNNPNIYTKAANFDDERSAYYRYQIIQVAKKLEYYAYLEGYRSWVGLAIEVEKGVRIELILSFHEVGYDHKGVMVCAGFATRLIRSSDEQSNIEDVQPLASSPFEFTYLEEKSKVTKRFVEWLEEAVQVGLEYWRQNL